MHSFFNTVESLWSFFALYQTLPPSHFTHFYLPRSNGNKSLHTIGSYLPLSNIFRHRFLEAKHSDEQRFLWRSSSVSCTKVIRLSPHGPWPLDRVPSKVCFRLHLWYLYHQNETTRFLMHIEYAVWVRKFSFCPSIPSDSDLQFLPVWFSY